MPYTGIETKYIFLTINPNITDALRSLSFTTWLSSGQDSYPIEVGKAKALPFPLLGNASGCWKAPGLICPFCAQLFTVYRPLRSANFLWPSPECHWDHGEETVITSPLHQGKLRLRVRLQNSVSSHQIKHKITQIRFTHFRPWFC